jgi:molybdopterin molybdotransferase
MAMLNWQEALHLVLENTRVVPVQAVPLGEAVGRVLSDDLTAPFDVPGFTNSAMDGYAVVAGDTLRASADTPVELAVVATLPAGKVYEGRLDAGAAIEIMTGAPVPEGADAVIRVEDTEILEGNRIRVRAPVAPGTAVRKGGSDSPAGSLLCAKGAVITPAHVGLLASCGFRQVKTHGIPRVSLITSGDEVIQELISPMPPAGKIMNSVGPMVSALVRSWGAELTSAGHVCDDPAEMRNAIVRARNCEVLIVSGGVSMGRRDFVRGALRDLGGREIFWRVNQQPGGPLLFGMLDGVIVFGLPGNPVSSHVCCDIYVRACLGAAAGREDCRPRMARVRMGGDLSKSHSKTVFVRGRLSVEDGEIVVCPTTSRQESHVLHSLVGSHGYVVFETEQRILCTGDPVAFIVTDDAAFSDCAARVSSACSGT